MNRGRLLISILAFGLFSVIFPSVVLAQAIDSFSISATPEYPKEFVDTTLVLESFSTDLNRARITWKENGVTVADEIGLKQKTFRAPKNGFTKVILVEIVTKNGYKIKNQYTLSPQAIDLLWEAPDSYVPPFYRGKALAGEQSVVRVVAIPNFTKGGVLVDRAQTIYNWTRNNTEPEGSSGYGKSGFTFRFNPLKNSETLKVLAGTLDGSTQVEESLTLRPSQTQVILYETSPLLGTIYGLAFTKGLRLITNELTLVAEPYYFSGATDIRSNNSFVWSVGGQVVETGSDPMRLTLRKPDSAGQTNIGIAVAHINKTLQSARALLPIVYEK